VSGSEKATLFVDRAATLFASVCGGGRACLNAFNMEDADEAVNQDVDTDNDHDDDVEDDSNDEDEDNV